MTEPRLSRRRLMALLATAAAGATAFVWRAPRPRARATAARKKLPRWIGHT